MNGRWPGLRPKHALSRSRDCADQQRLRKITNAGGDQHEYVVDGKRAGDTGQRNLPNGATDTQAQECQERRRVRSGPTEHPEEQQRGARYNRTRDVRPGSK